MPRGAKERKLTAVQFRSLIAKYDIEFLGPIPPSRWPKRYADIFHSIRKIDRLRFDEYFPTESRDILSVLEKKQRVLKVNQIAGAERRQRANEASWRQNTEHHVVSRFGAEVIW